MWVSTETTLDQSATLGERNRRRVGHAISEVIESCDEPAPWLTERSVNGNVGAVAAVDEECRWERNVVDEYVHVGPTIAERIQPHEPAGLSPVRIDRLLVADEFEDVDSPHRVEREVDRCVRSLAATSIEPSEWTRSTDPSPFV